MGSLATTRLSSKGQVVIPEEIRERLEPLLALLAVHAEFVKAPALPEPVSADPDDDKFLACAVAAGVTVIVSADKHLVDQSG